MKKLILWAIGIALFICVMEMISDYSKEDCETRISQEFKSETKWIDSRCYIKDWGRVLSR